MKTSKWLVFSLATALAVGGLAMVKAKADGPGMGRFGTGRFLERAKSKLGLTDAQVVQIKTQLKGDSAKLETLLHASHEARIDLRKVIQTPGATEDQVRDASAKLAAAEADMAVERASLNSKIRPILTTDQLDKIADFQDRMDEFVDTALAKFAKRLAE